MADAGEQFCIKQFRSVEVALVQTVQLLVYLVVAVEVSL